MKKENKEIIKFKIEQLRKEAMTYALESIALTFIVELAYVLLANIFELDYSKIFAIIALLVPTSYFIYMSIGNTKRRLEIKKLEKELYKFR